MILQLVLSGGMVVVMFAWQKLVDARGRKWTPCTIRYALKSSGFRREYFVSNDDTGRFWPDALYVGLAFGTLMTIWGELARGLFGLDISFAFFTIPGLVQFCASVISFGAAMGVMNRLYGWRDTSAAIRAMTRAGLCPSCAYRIDSIEPEPDECTVCPECGGAWRMSKLI